MTTKIYIFAAKNHSNKCNMSKVSFNFGGLLLIVSLYCNTFCNNRNGVFRQLEQVENLLSTDKDNLL